MLIKVDSITGVEFFNPQQITRVSPLRDSVIIHFVDQSVVVLMHPEWERIEPMVAMPPTILEERYHEALHTVYRQAGLISALQARINPPAADDDQDDQQAFIDANEPL